MKMAFMWLKFPPYPAVFLLLANIQEAIALYLESLEAHNEPIPPPISEELVEVEL